MLGISPNIILMKISSTLLIWSTITVFGTEMKPTVCLPLVYKGIRWKGKNLQRLNLTFQLLFSHQLLVQQYSYVLQARN